MKAGRANEFAPEAGLSSEDLQTALGLVRERFTVAAAGIASYDPALDVDGSVLHAAVAGVLTLVPPAGVSPMSGRRLSYRTVAMSRATAVGR